MRTWDQLTTAELYGFLRLRCDVFMWEQRVDDEAGMPHRSMYRAPRTGDSAAGADAAVDSDAVSQ